VVHNALAVHLGIKGGGCANLQTSGKCS
jgi:hypothetical protein